MPCRTLKPSRFGACVRGCLRRPVIRELLTGYLIRGRFSALSWVVSVWSASKSSSSSSSFSLKEDEFPVSLERVFPTPRDFMFGTSCRSLQYFCWLLEWLKENLKWQEIFPWLRFLTYCYHFSINKTEKGKKRKRAYLWTPCGTYSQESRNFSVSLLKARLAHADTTPVVWPSPLTLTSVIWSCACVPCWLQRAACVSASLRFFESFLLTQEFNFLISLFSLLQQVLSSKFTIVVNSKQTDNSG